MRGLARRVALALALAAMPALLWAGPEGRYTVEGTSPGSSGSYRGTVEVVRTGDTYAVRWEVGNDVFLGTGLGAANVKGVATMGPASSQDTALSVAYVSDGSFGLTFYVEQPNGQWRGIWTYAGSDKIATEIWTPE